MKRTLLIWIGFAACVLVGFGVLAWFSREMLRLDREAGAARRVAVVEENIRLALWRMDSALASVHGLEAARPWQEYESFFPAEAAYAGDLAPLPGGTVMLPSPLLKYAPPFIRLHFQFAADGALRSPQAPPPPWRTAAISAGASPEKLDAAADRLARLSARLVRADFDALAPPNAALATAAPEEPKQKIEGSPVQSLVERISRRRAEQQSDVAERELAAAAPAAPAPALPEAAAESPRIEVQQQQVKSATEQLERDNLLYASNELNAEVAAYRRAQAAPAPPASRAATDAAAGATASSSAGALFSRRGTNQPEPAQQRADLADAASPRATNDAFADQAPPREEASDDSRAPQLFALSEARADAAKNAAPADDDELTRTPDATAGASASSSFEGPLQALWTGGELVLARRVSIDGRMSVQGAWLDWEEIQAWLLSRVSDLLPSARLEPVFSNRSANAQDAARRLAFLPVQLVPGAVPVGDGSAASPLRISLAAAWGSAVLGAGALALLLAGTLRLSERRGAFVSAVTHELRTPLTTFRMYTEMLAGGMVADPEKRRGYIDTLRQEAERLSHLVENVLSYARLERGRARSRVEHTTIAELLARSEARLRQRAEQARLEFRVALAPEIAALALQTDLTAVEQILFNLVDNAAKYGRRLATADAAGASGELTLALARAGNSRIALRVADQGPGLAPAMRKRLFRPFSKSANEAAHSQPGVGLGLALSRRLARDLGGELSLERTGADGTVFRLELPLHDAN